MLLTEEQFLIKAKEKHNNKYNFDNINYINGSTPIDFKCECGNKTTRIPTDILRTKNLCSVCGIPYKRKTTEQFIKEAREKHKEKFDYSEVVYKNKDTPVKIKCNCCGNIMFQTPHEHLSYKYGCSNVLCKNSPPSGIKYTTETFIKIAKEKFGDEFDYSEVNYVNTDTPVKIKCNKCQTIRDIIPNTFLIRGCCIHNKESFGEKIIRIVLEKNNINYIPQYIFKDCRNINPLLLISFLPDNNILIEFQGKQHYEPVDMFGGIEGFLETQKHDQIKREYSLKKRIRELEIPYWELRNIDKILNTVLAKN